MNNKLIKCIEILYDRAYYNENMTMQIKKEFTSKTEFICTLVTLYGHIAINNILHYSEVKPNFDLSIFFDTGKIVPLEKKVKNTTQYKIYKDFINALKKGDYIFDSEGIAHIIVNNISIELDSITLHNLAEGLKNSLYQKLYLYNKKRENDITDENSLQNYLYHTKTMLVETNDIVPSDKIDKIFNFTKSMTRSKLKYQPSVKVDDIIKTFESQNKTINFKVSKFKLPSTIYIVKKANKLGNKFYNLPLQSQKKLICEWILEYINSNIINNEVTEDYIMSIIKPDYKPRKELNKQNIIPGLTSLYINLLTSLNIDFTQVALFNFKIKTYLSDDIQKNLLELQSLIKQINKTQEYPEEELIERIERLSRELNEMDYELDTEKLIMKNNELQEALYELKCSSSPSKDQLARRNELQSLIHKEQEDCLTEIAFDNEKIMALIKNAVDFGRVYINPLDKNKITIESYNKELGRVTFQCEISVLKMLDFISTNNCLLDERQLVFR